MGISFVMERIVINMRMIFKQRIFTWFDSYDIYNEAEEILFTVQGQLSWGHCFKIFDSMGNEVGIIKQVVLSFLPRYEIYINGSYVGSISKEFTFFVPKYDIDYNGWHIDGDFFEWDYKVIDSQGNQVASIYKEIFKLTDTYVIDVDNQRNALATLMLVLAIDAEKCSRNN